MKPVAVDTNILVRLATGDNAREYRIVAESLAARPWRVFPSVILETEWVLRSVYGYSRAQFADFVTWLGSNDRVALVDGETIHTAIAWHREGLDFADALHISQTDGEPFLTLDKALQRKATRQGLRAETPGR